MGGGCFLCSSGLCRDGVGCATKTGLNYGYGYDSSLTSNHEKLQEIKLSTKFHKNQILFLSAAVLVFHRRFYRMFSVTLFLSMLF